MALAGYEPTIPTSERPHTNALDRAASERQLALNRLFKDSNFVFVSFLKFFEIKIGKY